MPTGFVNFPSSTTFMASVGEWSGSLFSNLLNIAVVVVGFTVGGLLIAMLINTVIHAVSLLTHRPFFGVNYTSKEVDKFK